MTEVSIRDSNLREAAEGSSSKARLFRDPRPETQDPRPKTRWGEKMKGTWIRIVLLLLMVLALAVGGGWWMMRGQLGGNSSTTPPPKAAPKPPADPAPTVTFAKGEAITLPGVIEPYESLPVAARSSPRPSPRFSSGTAVW